MAAVTTETKTVTTINLELTQDEADALRALLGPCSGLYSVFKALGDAGITGGRFEATGHVDVKPNSDF